MKATTRTLPRWAYSLRRVSIVPLLLGCLEIAPFHATAQAPAPDSPAIETKARELLAKLTLEQKIELIAGVDGMFTHAESSIDLPRFKTSDASVGVRSWGPTTAYAGGVALAATWDRDFARELGESLGKDARARDVNILLGPGVNIARSPTAARNFEYLSEDPYLNAALVVPYIEGVQSQGVVATVKHYALNNEEYNRHNVSVDVDERTTREIYLPPFEAAVTKAHVDAVMNSYNLINGVHATQNAFLNLKVLKGDWDFQGILMADWGATYDGVAAANNGLDLEMPSPRFMNSQTLLPAIKSGAVQESTIDDKVLRLLRVELRYGFTERPQWNPVYPTYSISSRAVALKGALESITLLKNENHFLPLDPAKVKTVAVIGPNAWPAVPGGGGSAEASAFAPVGIVTGLVNLLGPQVRILYTRGLPQMEEIFWRNDWEGGVKQENYPSTDFTGTPQTTTPDGIAEYNPNVWGPIDKTPRSIRYTTAFKATQAGKYLVLAASAGADDYHIFIDGKELMAPRHTDSQIPESWKIHLNQGQLVRVRADYLPHDVGICFGLGMAYEPDLISEDVKRFAAAADAVIVAAGFNPTSEHEASDRTFELPWAQDTLIEAAVAANPRTIVTITGGGGMDVEPWIDRVPALLHLFYPGQEGGSAVTDVIFGRHDPEGKLPVSFDRTWKEDPSYNYYYPVPGADTTLHVAETGRPPVDYVISHVRYEDKLMVGYRYWTTTGKHPLFPFGFGLSYTTFRFSNLDIPATAASGATVLVSFDVTNTGNVSGAEVAQLYISDPSATVARPERELKGFEKVRLDPSETKHVTIKLDSRSFSYWDEATHNWKIDPGKFVIRVANSSENTVLQGDVTLN